MQRLRVDRRRESIVGKKRVLFVCTGNSCRSQMAEGFLRFYGNHRFDVFSAGSNPTALNPSSVKVMKEKEIDISGQYSKLLDQFLKDKFDYIITVCDNAKEVCPFFPGETKRMHWSFQDPAEAEGTEKEKLVVFRRIRDEIEKKIREILEDD